MLAELGAGFLLAALALTGFALLLSTWAARHRSEALAQTGRRAFYAATFAIVAASVTLLVALLAHDFTIAYVAEHTDRATPTSLVAAAFYGGQEGSLLYWVLVLTVLGAATLSAAGRDPVDLVAYATAILSAIVSFFLVVLVFVASPFELLAFTPPDGLGLNPILRDTGMLIHPPPSYSRASAPSRFPSALPSRRSSAGAGMPLGSPAPGALR